MCLIGADGFIGESLEDFTIEEFTEVYKVEEDGRYSYSLGYFKDEAIAKGFANTCDDPSYLETEKRIVLTNGKIGFIIGDPIKILDDENAVLRIKEEAIAKLTPEERKILKIQ